MDNNKLTVVNHPLVQHKLTLMRGRSTPSSEFRRLLRETSLLLAYEVMRDLPLVEVEIETPLTKMTAPRLAGDRICLFSVLRAGEGLLQGLLELVPDASVGHVGLYRDHETLEAVEYYFRAPDNLEQRLCIVVDPMLATGHSADAAIQRVRQAGGRNIRYLCLLAAPDGIATLQENQPDVHIYTAAIDEKLNDKGYIVPGLGDAGDRIFGTE